MIVLHKVRELDLVEAPADGRPAYVSAASGLVCVKDWLYVIADDELHLGVFPRHGKAPGSCVRLFEGVLPAGKKDRKKHKPDFEALVLLPPFGDHPHGALLAFGSGSRANRRLAALVSLGADGAVCGSPQTADLSEMLIPLEGHYPALNVEGAVASGDDLRLFQRGNKKHRRNAVIRFPLPPFLKALHGRGGFAIAPTAHQVFDLGDADGIPFGFTDAAPLPDGEMMFSAVAEDTDDPYRDGRCAGAAIGMIGTQGDLRWFTRTNHPHKIEGIHAERDGNAVKLQLVTDADDIEVPARLLSAAVTRSG